MIQAIVKKGKVIGEEVPAPNVSKGSLLIKVVNSCISAGTEMTSVKGSGTPLIKRALNQPQHVKKVIDMVRSEGIAKAYAKVKGKLDTGMPTGYSISGVVISVGEGVNGFSVGDHVAAAGAGLANHAEFVDVPENLVMKMPEGMDFKSASTVTLGGIALQGVRRVDLRLGEFCVVVGAGILGLLSVQMLVQSGVRVVVIDLDNERLKLALELGAEKVINPTEEDAVSIVEKASGGYGADAVLFTAATASSEPLSDSFKMCRKKGKVVMVGVSGMNIDRADMYAKELDFILSCSYGPGRYDKNYENKGLDYPYAYVRWTENRNMTEYLRLVSEGKLNTEKLVNAVYSIEEVTQAFDSLKSEGNKPLMVLLDYGSPNLKNLDELINHSRKQVIKISKVQRDIVNIALVGAGNFAVGMHLPNIEKLKDKYRLKAVVNRTGHKAKEVAKQFQADYVTTNIEDVLKDPEIDLVLISTRHDSHAELVLQSLQAGKHVFVEKPLAISQDELAQIKEFYSQGEGNKPVLFTGFNRRFSDYATEIKKHVDQRVNPLMIRYRMNAGYIPLDHWVHEDGGRMVGEACHIIDLMTYLTGSQVESVSVDAISPTNEAISQTDNKTITLKYKDGSVATIHYIAIGSKQFPKEQMEVYFDEKTIVMDDYKNLTGYGVKVANIETQVSEKGQLQELSALYPVLKGEADQWPIELWDMVQTTEISLMV